MKLAYDISTAVDQNDRNELKRLLESSSFGETEGNIIDDATASLYLDTLSDWKNGNPDTYVPSLDVIMAEVTSKEENDVVLFCIIVQLGKTCACLYWKM